MCNYTTIPLAGVAGTKLTGKSVKQNLIDSGAQFETLKAFHDKFKPDGLFTFMDLTIEAEALGLKINLPENDTPSVAEHPIKDKNALMELKKSYKGKSARMDVIIDVVRKMKQNIDTTIGAYVIGPFSLAGELNGVNDLLVNTIMDTKLTEEIIDYCTEIISEYANELYKAGADTVCVLEPTAVMLSEEDYEKFSLKPFKKILKNVNNKPLMLHICGNSTHLIEKMGQSGACGLSLDAQVDLKGATKQIPVGMKLIGNLDPIEIFLNGDEQLINTKTSALIEEMKDFPNFVLSSGCDLPLNTPLKNIEAFMNKAKQLNS
ncbi:MAG: uroporphyrinogen decarboxylase family protein [Bacteroidota bacterium]